VEQNGSLDAAYYLVYPTEFRHGKPLEAFRAWLLEQAGAYAGIE
jgi:LysR family transcriptional regulator, glycine cleavage system transcriptional activator